MKLKKILFVILFINASFVFSEESGLESYFLNSRCQLEEVKVIDYGTLEEKYISEINKQEFCFKDCALFIPSIKLYSFCYKQKTYLILLSETGKYGDKICYIFDITDPDNIKCYPPEKRFIEAEMLDKFVGMGNIN